MSNLSSQLLRFAMLLVIVQAVPPVPRKTFNAGAGAAEQNKKQADDKKKPASPVENLSVGKVTPAESSKDESTKKNGQYAPESITIAEAAPVPVRDWVDYVGLVLAALLSFAGIGGIIYAYKTLKAIQVQSAATEKSVRLQEVGMQQWINIQDVEVSIAKGWTYVMGVPQIPDTLKVSFNAINSTKMPMILEWAVIKIPPSVRDDRTFHHFLAPDDVYPINIILELNSERLEAYKKSQLVFQLIVTLGYTDAFEKLRRQPFGVTCLCSPPHGCVLSPFEGALPDDTINLGQSDQG